MVGDTGRGGRVKSGQEELRARPGPLLCPAYESQGIKSRLHSWFKKLSEDMVGSTARSHHPSPSPPALHAQLRNPLGTLALSYRKTYFGYSDVTSWHSEAVGMEKLTGWLGQGGTVNTNHQEKMSPEQAGGLREGSRKKEGVRQICQESQAGTKPTAWQRSLSPHSHTQTSRLSFQAVDKEANGGELTWPGWGS